MNGNLKLPAMLLCLTLLAGCASQPSGDTAAAGEHDKTSTAEVAVGLEEPAADGPTEPEESTGESMGKPAENLFESMPSQFMFCSGAGAWSTVLTIAEDGTFTGLFHDSNNNIQYICEFTGAFTQPEKVSDYVYSMEIETLELEHPADGTEEYADGIHYIYSGPYGLEKAGELRIYLPDTPVEEMPEMAIRAARGPDTWQAAPDGTLGIYVIYNVNEELGFAEFPRETGED